MPSLNHLFVSALYGLAGFTTVVAQLPPVARQSTDFNSTAFALTASQIAAAELTPEQAENIRNIVNFDRSQLANGGPYEDAFYTLPPLAGNASGALAPGTLLRAQPFTDPTPFSLPASTALSRILYTTTTLNGTVVPASAFVLWPYRPRAFSSSPNATQAPVVLWGHGTSGWFPSQAPSAARNLWYGDAGPFALALAGYAVVAPDYAGLGVGADWHGARVPHQYLASPAGARDALNALQAARAAFAGRLTDAFVAMGHSQGGGVAWAVAELLAATSAAGGEADFADLRPGYRGALAMSPTTEALPAGPSQDFWAFLVSTGAASVVPGFRPADWLTPVGAARARLLREVEGGIMVSQQLLDRPLLRANWTATAAARAYGAAADAGRKPFRGPLLVVQGTADAYVAYATTAATVAATCGAHGGDLEFVVLDGVGHVPALDAARPYWLAWIEARFARAPLARPGCGVRTDFRSFLPTEQHQNRYTAFPQWAGAPEYGYQLPVGS